ncbi:MAG: protein kinase [Planctomycetes bacterium]|nr:protein kinase [Planctomycetota bacterium]
MPPPRETTDLIGKEFRGCLVLKKLGAGGMGAVYLGRHTTLRREVAIKFLGDTLVQDESSVARFLREARALAELEDAPHIVKVYDCGVEAGRHFIVMQYVAGTDLDGYVKGRGGRLDPPEAVRVILQALRGLKAAHDHGIVHRDIKPANILVSKEGQVRLTDFGLVRRLQDTTNALTVSGELMGTPLFMSPEQWRGEKVDARTDVYSLGATLYYLLSGAFPFNASSIGELTARVLSGRCDPIESVCPAVDRRLGAVVSGMMAADREERFADAQTAIEALETWSSGGTRHPPIEGARRSGRSKAPATAPSRPEARPTPRPGHGLRDGGVRSSADPSPGAREPRAPRLAAFIAGVGLLALGIAVYSGNRDRTPPPAATMTAKPASSPTPPPPPPSFGSCLISVSPKGAAVLLDGEALPSETGGTYAVTKVKPGKHEVIVRMEGFTDEVRSLSVSRNQQEKLEIRLGAPGMVYVPRGRLQRGLAYEEARRLAEGITHDSAQLKDIMDELLRETREEIEVPGFYLDACKVSNDDYLEYVREAGGRVPENWTNGLPPPGAGEYPVVFVNWEDARKYAGWKGKRLPTEVEWERAVRGDLQSYYPWGNTFDRDRCVTNELPRVKITSVKACEGGKCSFGAYNLVGITREWTADSRDAALSSRIIKGAGYGDLGAYWGIFCVRASGTPEATREYIGFRCARDGE